MAGDLVTDLNDIYDLCLFRSVCWPAVSDGRHHFEDHSGFEARLETCGDLVTDLKDVNDLYACLDLSVGLLSVTTDIIWKITVSFEAGLVACKAIRYI